jgi:hypothetical protein
VVRKRARRRACASERAWHHFVVRITSHKFEIGKIVLCQIYPRTMASPIVFP